MAQSTFTRTFSVRTDEVWTCKTLNGGSARRPVQVRKATVRVAKGQPGAGTFQGATNLRGTVKPLAAVTLVKSA